MALVRDERLLRLRELRRLDALRSFPAEGKRPENSNSQSHSFQGAEQLLVNLMRGGQYMATAHDPHIGCVLVAWGGHHLIYVSFGHEKGGSTLTALLTKALLERAGHPHMPFSAEARNDIKANGTFNRHGELINNVNEWSQEVVDFWFGKSLPIAS